ncbi:hypothetical protein GCM10009647_048010 [Streptomyces sanglieri]
MYRGDNVAYIVDTDEEEFLVIDQGEGSQFDIGEEVYVQWEKEDCLLFSDREVA